MGTILFQSETPLYYQVKEIIREKIVAGLWPPGTKLPSENELANLFSVSRITIRQAVLDLVRQGLLYRKQGKGTFVASPKVEADFIKVFFPEELTSEHKNISIEQIAAAPSIVQALGLAENEQVLRLIRVRFFNNEAAVLEKSYVPATLCPDLLLDPPTGKLYKYLAEKYGIYFERAETYVEPIILGEFESKLLGIKKGMPALQLNRRNFCGGKPIVLSDSIIRGDRCRLIIQTSES